MEKDTATFEQRLSQVRDIIGGIEGGNLSLEESVRQYEAGIRILNSMEKELTEIKRRITALQELSDGSTAEVSMEENT